MLLTKKPRSGAFEKKKLPKVQNCKKMKDILGPKNLEKKLYIIGKINFFSEKVKKSQVILAFTVYARLKKKPANTK